MFGENNALMHLCAMALKTLYVLKSTHPLSYHINYLADLQDPRFEFGEGSMVKVKIIHTFAEIESIFIIYDDHFFLSFFIRLSLLPNKNPPVMQDSSVRISRTKRTKPLPICRCPIRRSFICPICFCSRWPRKRSRKRNVCRCGKSNKMRRIRFYFWTALSKNIE